LITGADLSDTVKAVAQELLLPTASVTVTVITCVPKPTRVPAGGSCTLTSERAGVKSSCATTPRAISGTRAKPLAFAEADWAAGQVNVGGVISVGVVSDTVNGIAQELLLPAASVTVTVITCAPDPTGVPAEGACVFTSEAAGVQLSSAVTVVAKSGTSA
jgi:hypothetical protein